MKILKKKKSSRTPSHQGYKRFIWKATLSSCNNWHRFRRCFFPFLFSRSQHVLYTLMEKLDKMISQQFLAIWKNDFQSNPSETNATAIADGMFILNYSNRNLPKTNPALVRRVLVKFLNVTKICKDPCFEMYDISSIKDVKRKHHGDIEIERRFCIGPCLKIPSNINELLKISSFKRSVLDFLMNKY